MAHGGQPVKSASGQNTPQSAGGPPHVPPPSTVLLGTATDQAPQPRTKVTGGESIPGVFATTWPGRQYRCCVAFRREVGSPNRKVGGGEGRRGEGGGQSKPIAADDIMYNIAG